MLGQWIVVDAVPDRVMSLLQVGDSFHKGVSVRKNLSRGARSLLFDRLEKAVQEGAAVDTVAELDGQPMRVVVQPILSPASGTPVGAMGVYLPVGQPVPPRPQVGSMEWTITPDGQRSSVWDATMYSIYGMNAEDQEVQAVPPGMWLAKYVAREDQDRLLKLISDGIATASITDRALISYHIVTLHGKSKKLLEMSVAKHVGDGNIYLRGLTRQVPSVLGTDVLPGEVSAPQSALDAMVELMGDVPLAQVDYRNWELFQVSPGWAEAGLEDPESSSFLDMVHGDQREVVRQALESRDEASDIDCLKDVRMRSTYGKDRVVDISYRVLPNKYAMLRILPRGWVMSSNVS